MNESKYFAAKPADQAVGIIMSKAQTFYNFQSTHGLLDKLQNSWKAYHGAYYDNVSFGHTITFGGEQGELTQIPVNHYRNIAQHILVMTTSSRPAMDARAVNTDYKSQIQAKLAKGILDYYMREKDLESYIKNTVEIGVVLGSGFLKVEWDNNAGEIYEYELDDQGNPDPSKPIREGDLKFQNLTPFDVVFDSFKENYDNDWVITRTFKNKYDLSAKYPDLKDKIEALQSKSEQMMFKFTAGFTALDETDDIPVYEFYHRKSDSLPEGRYILFLSEQVILHDGPMPYRDIPIIRIAPSDIMGTPYGYSPMFDLLPLQEAVNSLYSTILTNQNAFGVQNLYVPRGADIVLNSLEGGLNIIEGNPQAGPPQALNLTQTPKEIFDFLGMIVKDMETLSGVNSVSRGNPEASLRSGAALALVQSLALQFTSNLQQQYIKCIEKCGTLVIKTLQDFALAKRTVTIISGISNQSEIKEFSADDLTNISRITVDVANPLTRTTSGKVQMAESLLQYGAIKDPREYLTIVNSGNLENATEKVQSQLDLMRLENENLLQGRPAVAVAIDMHMEHINSHRSVIDDPELRKNPELVQNVLSHIQEHLNLLTTTDPNLLQLLGQQPIAPPMPPQPGPGGVMQTQQDNGVNPSQEGQNAMAPAPNPGEPPMSVTGPAIEGNQNVPQPAKPPAPFNNMPTDPRKM